MNKLQQIVNNKWFPFLFIVFTVFISIIQHYRIFNLDFVGVHTWRQTQTQTVIQNFAFNDFFILNPHINDITFNDGLYRMEFPLMQWLVAVLYKIFGNHLIITRIAMFVITFFTVLGMFKITVALTNKKLLAYLLTWVFLFSPIIYYYSVNPIPDNLALCTVVWAIYFWIKHIKSNNLTFFIISAIFFALSMALKLPFIVFGGLYLSKILNFEGGFKINFKYLSTLFFICLLPLAWYLWVINSWNGNGVVTGLLNNKITFFDFFDIFQFHLISTLPELLVNYATFPFFLIGFWVVLKHFNWKEVIFKSFFYVSVLVTAYFFFEINMIAKVHDYYLFPFLPLIFIIVLKGLDFSINSNKKIVNFLILITVFLCPFTAYLRCNNRWNLYMPGTTKEYVLYKDKIQKALPKNAKVIVDNEESNCIKLYYLNKKGWGCIANTLVPEKVKERIAVGATHICLEDKKMEALCFEYLDTLVLNIPPLKIYKLKQK